MSEPLAEGWVKLRSQNGLWDVSYVSSGRINYGEGHDVKALLSRGYIIEPVVVLTIDEHAAAAAEHAAALARIAELESQLAERDAQAAVSEVSIHNLIVRIRELERHFPYPEGGEDGE